MAKNSVRFFVQPKNISGSNVVINNKEIVDQINKVLRLQIGGQIIVLDNSGREFQVVLKDKDRGMIKGEIISEKQNEAESEIDLTLYQSLIKKDKFEWVLQKGTELGIKKFVPVIAERSVKIIDQIPARWLKIVREAAEQSGRGKLPEISEIKSFKEAVELGWVLKPSLTSQKSYIADCSGKSFRVSLGFSSKVSQRRPASGVGGPASGWQTQTNDLKTNLFIGPEGGFSEKELALAQKCGIIKVSLGRTTLRAETAAIVGCALLLT